MRAASTEERILRSIERALDLIHEGQLEEAEEKLEKIRKRTPDVPAVYYALGELACAYDDPDEAVEQFLEAASRDPEWPDPLIEAGWVELERSPERALSIAAQVVERFAADREIHADGLMLRGAALIELERTDDARVTLSELEALEPDDPELCRELAAAWCDTGDLDRAERIYRTIVARDPEDADTLHALGACLHERGARDEATEAWLKVRALDQARPRGEDRIEPEELERLAERTLRELPDEVRRRLTDVPIVIEDVPSEALVREGLDPRALGLFTGTPLPLKSALEGQPTAPDAAILFLRNLEDEFIDPEELAEEVRITILHETAHFFGLDDDDLEALGLG